MSSRLTHRIFLLLGRFYKLAVDVFATMCRRFMLFVREHSELRYRMENKNLGYDSRKYIDSLFQEPT